MKVRIWIPNCFVIFRNLERYSVVGAPFDDDVIVRPECNRYESCTNPGSAYVFTRDDDNKWTQSQSKLLAPDGDWRDNFGKSVAIDKDTIVYEYFLQLQPQY